MRDYTGYSLDNRYILKKIIAKGGSSVVYLAGDASGNLKKEWCCKCVSTEGDPEQIRILKKEVALLDELDHPNIVNIIYYTQRDECFFFVMDFIKGRTLEEMLEKDGPRTERFAADICITLCSVLGYLHTVHKDPIIFSDLKPANVMLDEHDMPFLLDMGIAHEVIPGTQDTVPAMGTKGYAAPEQYKSGTRLVDERTDIYGMGALLYSMITGEVPEREYYPLLEGRPEKQNDIKKTRPEVSMAMAHIVSKCMEPDPSKRYDSMDDLKQDLVNLSLLNEKYVNSIKRKLTYV